MWLGMVDLCNILGRLLIPWIEPLPHIYMEFLRLLLSQFRRRLDFHFPCLSLCLYVLYKAGPAIILLHDAIEV
jgi:hypothetical protein